MSSQRNLLAPILLTAAAVMTNFRMLRFFLLRLEIVLIPAFAVVSFYYVQAILLLLKDRIKGFNLERFDLSHRLLLPQAAPVNICFSQLGVKDGFWSFRHRRCAFSATSGKRPYMEDRMRYLYDPKRKIDILCLFDGHGGMFVADYLEQHFVAALTNRLKRIYSRGSTASISQTLSSQHPVIEAIMAEVWRQDDAICQLEEENILMTGSTMISVVLEGNNFVTVANVGDCRAVACDTNDKVVALSVDHKPDLPAERRRVELNGGFVKSLAGAPRVQGILAVSRAFGDLHLKAQGVITANPDVIRIDLSRRPLKFIIVASDGFWDVVSNKHAVHIADQYLKSHSNRDWSRLTRHLVRYALDHGSEDNVSVAFIPLQ